MAAKPKTPVTYSLMRKEAMDIEPIARLSKDLREALEQLTPDEVRFAVRAYYQIQEYRKSAANQARQLIRGEEPHGLIAWLFCQHHIMEQQIKGAMDRWTEPQPLCQWARSICGIGPVLAAGLKAHINLDKAPTAGNIWSFAGLNPKMVWEKGQKRPYNADLKTLCYKIGESFVKFQNHKDDFYGRYFVMRKALDWERNLSGQFVQHAQEQLKLKHIEAAYTKAWYSGAYDPDDVRKAMKGITEQAQTVSDDADPDEVDVKEEGEGNHTLMNLPRATNGRGVPMLPPAHIHSMARRFVVKLFLSHYHEVGKRLEGKEPPEPYVIAHLGHIDKVEPPNWPMTQAGSGE